FPCLLAVLDHFFSKMVLAAPNSPPVRKLSPAARGLIKHKRIGSGRGRQRAFGLAPAEMRKRAFRRTQYAEVRPVGGAVVDIAVVAPEADRPIGQTAFDAASG